MITQLAWLAAGHGVPPINSDIHHINDITSTMREPVIRRTGVLAGLESDSESVGSESQ